MGFARHSQGLVDDTVSVTTLTEVMTPRVCDYFEALTVHLENLDDAQTVDAWVQAGPTSAGPWDALDSADLTGIAPETSRSRSITTNRLTWLRVVATADGAGADVRAYVFGAPSP